MSIAEISEEAEEAQQQGKQVTWWDSKKGTKFDENWVGNAPITHEITSLAG